MQNLQLILFLLIFFAAALAMFLRKIPALLALPIMAFLIPLAGGVSISDTIQYVIGLGALKLHNAYTVALFGSMLSILLQRTGVAKNFIKKGAELAGDNPWVISVLMLVLIALLFTTLGGLGAIIMVATIVLPILSSIGVGPMTAVGIFLIGLSMGGILNAGNWAVYVDVMSLSIAEIRPFALTIFAITFITALIYISIQLYRDGHNLNVRKILYATISVLLLLTIFILIYSQLSPQAILKIKEFFDGLFYTIQIFIAGCIALLFLLSFIHMINPRKEKTTEIYWTAYFTPLIPLCLILFFSMNFIAAFICGLIYGFMATFRKGALNTLVQSIFEGGAVVMPAVALMFGIGMLLNAVMGPMQSWPGGWPILKILQPLMQQIIPTTRLMFVLLFGILAPLALYRGPFNVWGMGYGLAAVFLASGMSPGAVMGLLMAVGQVQGISDPTNTHNVWLANEMQQDVQKVLWNTIPYTWSIAFVGLGVAAMMFF
jgi:hypothetical protein